jgi:hypothetical protein
MPRCRHCSTPPFSEFFSLRPNWSKKGLTIESLSEDCLELALFTSLLEETGNEIGVKSSSLALHLSDIMIPGPDLVQLAVPLPGIHLLQCEEPRPCRTKAEGARGARPLRE